MSARFIIGDVFDALATLEDDSVDLVFSSPPFLALRSYLPADHPDKAKEIGSEATPADFLDTLLDVVEACDRVLAPHGSLCFELGDTYAGSGGAGGDYNDGGWRDAQPAFTGSAKQARVPNPSGMPPHRHRSKSSSPGGAGWPLDKSLCGIPTLFAWSLAYGRNLLRPERETPRWRIRNLVPWAKANPPVGSLGDKWRPGSSFVTVATKERDRYCDLDAVRAVRPVGHARTARGVASLPNTLKTSPDGNRGTLDAAGDTAGAPPLDWWTDATAALRDYFGSLSRGQEPSPTAAVKAMVDAGVMEVGDHLLVNAKGYKGAHYAVFAPEFVQPFVECYSPRRVCRVCGEPSRRITEVEYAATATRSPDSKAIATVASGISHGHHAHRETNPVRTVTNERRWSDCGHDDWRPGVLLDPFAGSGTSLAVATGHGRDAVGFDLDERNADLALERVGPMLLTVERLNGEAVA